MENLIPARHPDNQWKSKLKTLQLCRIAQLTEEMDALRHLEEELDALDNLILTKESHDQLKSKLQILEARVLQLREGKSQNFPVVVDENHSDNIRTEKKKEVPREYPSREDCIIVSEADLVAGEDIPTAGEELVVTT